ncbi:MAG: hypothetical protein NTX61_08965 [Bacteroidetes bacterium]|nr:hypothetical protein [Bacteroidota bacterium]
MENQKKRFIPSPPKGPSASSMPAKIGQKSTDKGVDKLPKMPEMPNVGFRGFKMVENMKKQLWDHHKKFHLDADGNWKPKLMEKGFKLMKKFKG